MGFSNLELTGPLRLDVGESSPLAVLSPPKPKAQMSARAVMSTAIPEASLIQYEEVGQLGEIPREGVS